MSEVVVIRIFKARSAGWHQLVPGAANLTALVIMTGFAIPTNQTGSGSTAIAATINCSLICPKAAVVQPSLAGHAENDRFVLRAQRYIPVRIGVVVPGRTE